MVKVTVVIETLLSDKKRQATKSIDTTSPDNIVVAFFKLYLIYKAYFLRANQQNIELAGNYLEELNFIAWCYFSVISEEFACKTSIENLISVSSSKETLNRDYADQLAQNPESLLAELQQLYKFKLLGVIALDWFLIHLHRLRMEFAKKSFPAAEHHKVSSLTPT